MFVSPIATEMENYSVKKLSGLAGISVRTLHLYDRIGLLKPSVRTPAGYRLYGEPELLRLQQILFYRELDFTLREIGAILDHPDFDLIAALENHKAALSIRKERLNILLDTIDKTINKIKNNTKMKHRELYEGLPTEKAEAWRKEAMDNYGKEAVERSEASLAGMTKENFAKLKEENLRISEKLFSMTNEDPESETVQEQIAQHYVIIRKLWGTHGDSDKQAEAYAGLGEVYVGDERYMIAMGKHDPQFARFMSSAMHHYAKTKLT